MPYRERSKCDGVPVSDQWMEQVVTFDGRPHIYNTMNLPSWNKHDYPFINEGEVMKESDWNTGSSNTDSNHLQMVWMHALSLDCQYQWPSRHNTSGEPNKIVRYKPKFTARMLTGHGKSDQYQPFYYYTYSSASDSTKLYHSKNLFHWDNNGRGAFHLVDKGHYDGLVGAHFGRLAWPCPSGKYPDRAGTWHDPARWTSKVFGIQFEWDSGVDFNDNEIQTDSRSNGYGLQDLFLHFVCVRPNAHGEETAETMVLPLFQDMKLQQDVCYWYEGYSLWDNRTWLQNGGTEERVDEQQGNFPQGLWGASFEEPGLNGPGQGLERGNPLRRGKCGFAVDSKSKLFEMLNRGTYTVDDRDIEMYGKESDVEDEYGHTETLKNGGLLDHGEKYLYGTEIHQNMREREWLVDDGTWNQNARLQENTFQVGEKGDSPASGHFILTGISIGLHRWTGNLSHPVAFRMWNVKPITVPVTYSDPEQKHHQEEARYSPYTHNMKNWNYDEYQYDEVGPRASGVIHDIHHPDAGHTSTSQQVLNAVSDGKNIGTGHFRYNDQYKRLKERGYPYDLPEASSVPITGAYAEVTAQTIEGNGGGIPS